MKTWLFFIIILIQKYKLCKYDTNVISRFFPLSKLFSFPWILIHVVCAACDSLYFLDLPYLEVFLLLVLSIKNLTNLIFMFCHHCYKPPNHSLWFVCLKNSVFGVCLKVLKLQWSPGTPADSTNSGPSSLPTRRIASPR